LQNPSNKEKPNHEVKVDSLKRPGDDRSPTEALTRTTEYKETILLLAKMMATIFLCEAAIMALLYVVPLSKSWSILADPVLLTVLGAPILYWLLVRSNTKEEPSHGVKAASIKRPRDNSSPTEALTRTTEYKETILLLAKMMATIFLCEAAIMALLYVVPLSKRWSILADPVLLTVLGAPILYWLLVRPIRRALENRRKAEQRLLVYQRQLKSLASQLSLTEERERHRLATDLHDQIGQSLIACKIKVDQLRLHSPPGEIAEAVQEIGEDLRQIIQCARNLISDLSCPILHDLGLEPALEEWLTEEIQRKRGIEAEFEDDGLAKPLDDDIRTVLFRNVRELLANVIEHAGANEVKVSVRRVDEDIHVRVEDDGVGFDPIEADASAAKRAKFGLLGIRERLEQVGGFIEITSETGGGTRISMTAPLKQTATDNAPQTT
jgi:signal transduction histidine kinase